MANPTPGIPQELEALFVSIRADFSELNSVETVLDAQVSRIESSLKTMEGSFTGAAGVVKTACEGMIASIKGVGDAASLLPPNVTLPTVTAVPAPVTPVTTVSSTTPAVVDTVASPAAIEAANTRLAGSYESVIAAINMLHEKVAAPINAPALEGFATVTHEASASIFSSLSNIVNQMMLLREEATTGIPVAPFIAFADWIEASASQVSVSTRVMIDDMRILRMEAAITIPIASLYAFADEVEFISLYVSTSLGTMVGAIGNLGTVILGLSALPAALQSINTATSVLTPASVQAFSSMVPGLVSSLTSLAGVNLTALGTALTQSATGLLKLANINLGGLTNNLPAIASELEVLSTIDGTNIGRIGRGLDAMAAGLLNFPTLNLKAIKDNITDLIDPLKKFGDISQETTDKIASLGGGVRAMATGLRGIGAIPDMAALDQQIDSLVNTLNRFGNVSDKVTAAISKIGSGLRSMSSGLGGVDALNVKDLETKINDLVGILGKFDRITDGVRDTVSKLGSGLRGISAGATGISALSPADMTALKANVAELIPLLGTFAGVTDAATAKVAELGLGIKNLSTGFAKLSSLDINLVTKQIESLIQVLNQFAAVSQVALTNIERLAVGLGGLTAATSRLGGGAGIPPIKVAMTEIPSAARPATAAIDSMTNSVAGLGRGIARAVPELNQLRFGLAAFAGVGLFSFAKFDDAMTRTLARMREQNRNLTKSDIADMAPGLSKAITDMSSKSIFNPTELVKGFNVLSSAGVQSMQALGIAEQFATVSGLKMDQASKILISTQAALGKSSTDVAEHIRNMTEIGDLFVHMSAQMGVSEEKLATSMGGRFIGAMQEAKLSVNEGVALLGVLARSYPKLQHEEVGTLASYGILELTKAAATHSNEWKELGIQVYDAQLKMRPMGEIMTDLAKKLGPIGTETGRAKEIIAGLGSRALAAINPLRGMADEFDRLVKEAGKSGGAMKLMADMIRDSFQNQMKMLWNNIFILAEAVGERLAPAFKVLGSAIGSLTQWFKDLNFAFQNLIVIFFTFALAIRPVIALVTWLVGALVIAPIVAFASIMRTLVTVLLTPFPVYLWRGLMMVFDLMAAPVKYLWSLFSGLVDTLMAAGSAIISVFTTIGKAIWSVLSLVYSFGKAIVDTISYVAQLTFKTIASMVSSLAAGLLSLILNLITFAIGLIASILLIIPALALIGALAATVGLGIAGLVGMLGGVWTSAKEGWEHTSHAIGDGLSNVGKEASHIWDGAKEKARDFADSAGVFITKVAGFFWNFGANVTIIFDWIGRNWRGLITDMGRLFFLMTENIAHDLKTFGLLIVDIGLVSWKTFWSLLGIYASPMFSWMVENWKNILVDMGNLFKTFLMNLVENFKTFLPLIFKMISTYNPLAPTPESVGKEYDEQIKARKAKADADIKYLTDWYWERQIEPPKGVFEGKVDAIRKSEDEDIARLKAVKKIVMESVGMSPAIKETFSRMKSPFEGFDPTTLQTKFGDLKGIFEKAGEEATKIMGGAGGVIGDVTKTAFGNMKNVFEGFKSVIGEDLLLKFDLPPDAMNKMKEMVDRVMKMFTGGGDESGMLSQKGGPGPAFKQISEARYMVGGTVAETLDYQQLLTMKQINENVKKLVEFANKKDNAPKTINNTKVDIEKIFEWADSPFEE